MIENTLFWERFRPHQIDDMVLLDRIKNKFKNGVQCNYIFHGYSGTGKTTLTKILLKNKNVKVINASLNNGIDVLREDLLDFCKSMNSPLIKDNDKFKYIYLEEFDGSSKQFQEGLKAFIEEYDDRIRFMITINNINQIIHPLISRFTVVDFNPQNNEEQRYLKNGYFYYLNKISKMININLSKETIINIINKHFPDLRSSVQIIQDIYISGDIVDVMNNKTDLEKIYQFLLDGENDFIKNYDFVYEYVNKPEELLNYLGRSFYIYLMKNYIDIVEKKGIYLIDVARDYNQNYNNLMVDPQIHLTSYICNIKKIINK